MSNKSTKEAKTAPDEIAKKKPSEDAIDQGVEESFPASDPVSVSITKIRDTSAPAKKH